MQGESVVNLARLVVGEDDATLKIIIVPDANIAGYVATLLARSFSVPKKSITQLGYTASDQQNDQLLRRRNPIVIVPESIFHYRPCTFYPPDRTTQVALIDGTTVPARVNRMACTEDPFVTKGAE